MPLVKLPEFGTMRPMKFPGKVLATLCAPVCVGSTARRAVPTKTGVYSRTVCERLKASGVKTAIKLFLSDSGGKCASLRPKSSVKRGLILQVS